jgi:hypothetical protein
MKEMSEETTQEVIKAIAFGMEDEDIANFAEITMDELESFKLDHAKEIEERKKEVEEFGE